MGPVDPRSKSTSALSHQHLHQPPPASAATVSPQGSDGVPGLSLEASGPASVDTRGRQRASSSDEGCLSGLASGDQVTEATEDACIVRISGDEGVGPRKPSIPQWGPGQTGLVRAHGGQTPNHSQRDGDSGAWAASASGSPGEGPGRG